MREVADPVSGPEVHRKAGDIHTVEQDLPGVRLGQPDHDVEGCRLACAVRAEQPNDLALADPQIDVIDNFASLVGLRQVNRGQNLHGRSLRHTIFGKGARLFTSIHQKLIIVDEESQTLAGGEASRLIIQRR